MAQSLTEDSWLSSLQHSDHKQRDWCKLAYSRTTGTHRQTMHAHDIHPHPSSHTSSFYETLTTSQTGPRLHGFYLLRSKPDWVWGWTASSNNQSPWHEQIKQRMYPSPGNVSKTPRCAHSAPGQNPWLSGLLWAKTVQTVARTQGHVMRIVAG